MTRPLRIAITSGDADGIGFEIVSKALAKIKPKANVHFHIWRSPKASPRELRRIDSYFKRITVSSWPEALKASPSDHKTIVDINSNLSPAAWVEQSAKAGFFGHIDALATAPLSKLTILQAGFKDIGHTEILRRVTGAPHLNMSFVGEKFSVLLMTGHQPISEVSGLITDASLTHAIENALRLRKLLHKKKQNLPIAVLGLNPHSGEGGVIGAEEKNVILPVLERLRKEKVPVEGPLVPDVAFQEQNWKKYSVYVSTYHDQGLIPFKMIHKHTGVHITLGLPFIRTSVDHGTAKDIFGKNKADAQSMIESIQWAISLCKTEKESL